MNRIGVALLGFGAAGQVFHAPLIATNQGMDLRVVSVRSSMPDTKRYPGVEIVRDPQDAVCRPDIDLVVVATPNTTHYSLARMALKHGKHVVVDKPFTIASDEAENLIKLAREQGLVLSVFHNRRWDGDFLTVRRVLANGWLGRIVEFESHFDRYRSKLRENAWREDNLPGSGVFYDLAPHLIDQAMTLFGIPDQIYADIRKQRDGAQTDDYFEAALTFGGTKAILKAGCLVREPGPRFIVHGTEGSFVKYGLDPQEANLKLGMWPNTADWGAEPAEKWGKLHTKISDLIFNGKLETIPGNYSAYYQSVYEAIVHGVKPVVQAEEALNVMRAMETALESAKTGRALDYRI